jgi:hypothetical protein
MRWWLVRVLAPLCLIFMACGPRAVQLSDRGGRLKVVPDSAIANCEFLQIVTSRIGANASTYHANVPLAVNDNRNKAAAAGATHLVLGKPERDTAGGWGNGKCENCVMINSNAYRCRK